MRFVFIQFILISLLAFNAKADEIKINTDPVGANILIRDFGGTTSQKLGKAPYVGNIQDLAANYAKSNFFMIVIEKEGFYSQSIALSDLLKSDIALNINLEPVQDFLKYKSIDKAVAELFEAQRLVRGQQYDEALELLKKVEEREKNLSAIPELIGAVHYLKKDLKTALAYYKKSFRLNPDNKDAYQMKAYLEKSLGVENDKP